MFERLQGRARQRAADRAAALAARLARTIAVPGVTAEAADGEVRLRGRGLRRRWLEDARLRWIGELLR